MAGGEGVQGYRARYPGLLGKGFSLSRRNRDKPEIRGGDAERESGSPAREVPARPVDDERQRHHRDECKGRGKVEADREVDGSEEHPDHAGEQSKGAPPTRFRTNRTRVASHQSLSA